MLSFVCCLPDCDVRLLLEPLRFVMMLPPIVGIDDEDEALLMLCLWFAVGLGEREILRVRFVVIATSSERLDCSDTPLSHVSYSASDCDDGEGQGESSRKSSPA